MSAERSEPSVEDAEDALLEGDRAFRTARPGSARAAWAGRTFRIVFLGAFASNIGTWMQNVVLGALAYELTGSARFVGLVAFCQLGPLLLLSLVGGAIADAFDRRRVLIAVAVEQTLLTVALALVVRDADPNRLLMLSIVFGIGVGQAVFAPTFSSVLPGLVGRENLSGAIALNSAQMNGSRVIGPAIGAVIYAQVGASWVFALNALTYGFIIGAVLAVSLPAVGGTSRLRGVRQVLSGLAVVRQDRVVRTCLSTIFGFSLLCLPFVSHLPVLSDDNLGIDPESAAYGWLYATFGLGAVAGALSIGSSYAAQRIDRLNRVGLLGFAASLTAFALLRDAAPAFPVVFIVGFCYFATITSLSTVLQHRLDEAVRGRVMALWIMGFGGTVPIGAIVAGPLIDATSITAVVLFGVVAAVALALYSDLRGADTPTPLASA